MFLKHRVTLTAALYERARAMAEKAGYSSVDEFVAHAVEKELVQGEQAEAAEAKAAVVKQLKGLGYLE